MAGPGMYAGCALGRDPRLQSGSASPDAVRRSHRAGRTSRPIGCCPVTKRSGTSGPPSDVRGDATRAAVRRSRPRAHCRVRVHGRAARAAGAPRPRPRSTTGSRGVIAHRDHGRRVDGHRAGRTRPATRARVRSPTHDPHDHRPGQPSLGPGVLGDRPTARMGSGPRAPSGRSARGFRESVPAHDSRHRRVRRRPVTRRIVGP